jgi:ABC-2 type transport system ATP-binding protein
MPWWNKKVEELSKGMQQKLQFVATVIHEPELLIFDEPFSGFDPINAELLKKEILKLKEAGHTVIFSTHNMASVEEICDDIALINRSRVILSGHVDDVRDRYKTNNYTLHIKGVYGTLPEWCTVLSEKERNGVTELRIHKENEISNSELLASLAARCEILSFTEEIPSMNEIFIKVVSESNSQ